MKMLSTIAFLIIIITMVLIMVLNLTSKKTIIDREKSSPFECGFDPKSSSRIPFSMHFFLIAIIFLIFDVEITLILPLLITMKSSSVSAYLTVTIMFIAILIAGLIHEWNQGALNWAS